jgi:hypothetical protein
LYDETAESHEQYRKAFVPLVTDKNTRFMRARKTQQELFKRVQTHKTLSLEDLRSESRLKS